MPVHLPAKIPASRFMDGRCSGGEIRGHMVFKAVLTDISQQLLHLRNLNYAGSAKGLERIVGESTLADIAGDLSSKGVGRKEREAHRPGLYPAVERSMGVLLADRPGDNLLKVHLHAFVEEMLRQVGAVEADSLIGIVSIVVVPI